MLTGPQQTQEFHCPNCHVRRPYLLKPVREVRLLYVILLFEQRDLTSVVECQVCKNGFDPEILEHSHQCLFKLATATRNRLLSGTSPGSLKVTLMSDGLQEEIVDKLIALALN